MAPVGRSRGGARGFGLAGRLSGGLGAPPYGHYDRVQGACWTAGADRSGGQARPEVSGTATAPLHENAAVERREARAPRKAPDAPRKRVRAARNGRGRQPGRLSALRPLAIGEGTMFRSRAIARRGGDCHAKNSTRQPGEPMMTTTLPDRRTPEQRARAALARKREGATAASAGNAMQFWRMCASPRCRRQRSCTGEPQACFERHGRRSRRHRRSGFVASSWRASRCNKGERVRAAEARTDGISENDRSERKCVRQSRFQRRTCWTIKLRKFGSGGCVSGSTHAPNAPRLRENGPRRGPGAGTNPE